MEIWLDSVDLPSIDKAVGSGLLRGVITKPSILSTVLADKNGRPILIKNRGAKGNEKEKALELLKRIQEDRSLGPFFWERSVVEADRGYDAILAKKRNPPNGSSSPIAATSKRL